jgi:hypothetical protein
LKNSKTWINWTIASSAGLGLAASAITSRNSNTFIFVLKISQDFSHEEIVSFGLLPLEFTPVL